MDTLPNEILIQILSKLDTKSLGACGKAKELWKSLGDLEFSKRIEAFNKLTLIEETKREIRSFLPPPPPQEEEEVDDDDSPVSSLQLGSLQIYEQSLLPPNYSVSTEVEPEVGSFLKYLRSSRNCKSCKDKDIDKCIIRSIHFMPCFNLLIVQISGKFNFYNEMDIYCNWSAGDEEGLNQKPYKYEDSHIKLREDNKHTLTSIYQNHVLYQDPKDIRALLLFKINSVNHEERKAQVEVVRRMHFPQWICALHLFNEKIFVVFTTGFVGCWDDECTYMAEDKCSLVNLAVDRDTTKIFRILNLLFIKQTCSTCPENYNQHWTLLDGNSTSLDQVRDVRLEMLFSRVFDVNVEDIISMSILNNGLFAHCKVTGEGENGEINEEFEGFFVARLKRELVLDDFLPDNIDVFEDLFLNSHRGSSSDNCIRFKGAFSAPIIISSFLYDSIYHSNLVTYFLGIEKTDRESKHKHTTKTKMLQVVSINIKNDEV